MALYRPLHAAALLFTALWLTVAPPSSAQEAGSSAPTWETLTPTSGEAMHRHENAYARVGDRFYLIGGRGDRLPVAGS